MDFQNRVGSKFGGGGIASEQQASLHRKEQLRKLALEQIDLSKDPYYMKNHLGGVDCKLCRTSHTNEGNYLAHTQGKLHKENLGRRAKREAEKTQGVDSRQLGAEKHQRDMDLAKQRMQRRALRMGTPRHDVKTFKDGRKRSIRFEVEYPFIKDGYQPKFRFMSPYEQKVEKPDLRYQFIVFAADPYETIAFKIPNEPFHRGHGQFETKWDRDKKVFTLQMSFLTKEEQLALSQKSSSKRKRDGDQEDDES